MQLPDGESIIVSVSPLNHYRPMMAETHIAGCLTMNDMPLLIQQGTYYSWQPPACGFRLMGPVVNSAEKRTTINTFTVRELHLSSARVITAMEWQYPAGFSECNGSGEPAVCQL